MTAGRELDALVAETVMGARWYRWLKVADLPVEYRGRFLAFPGRIGGVPGADYDAADSSLPLEKHCYASVPGYSTDIAAAWEVVEKLRASGWLVRVQEMPDGQPWLGPDDMDPQPKMFARAHCSLTWMLRETPDGVRRYIHEHPFALGSSAAEAICIAALKTVGAEVPA